VRSKNDKQIQYSQILIKTVMKELTNEMNYSVDLRKKVVAFIERNRNRREAGSVFEINYNTVRKWFSVYEEEHRIGPKEPYRRKPYKMDWDELRRYVEENLDSYQEEYAKVFGVSQGQISNLSSG